MQVGSPEQEGSVVSIVAIALTHGSPGEGEHDEGEAGCVGATAKIQNSVVVPCGELCGCALCLCVG